MTSILRQCSHSVQANNSRERRNETDGSPRSESHGKDQDIIYRTVTSDTDIKVYPASLRILLNKYYALQEGGFWNFLMTSLNLSNKKE